MWLSKKAMDELKNRIAALEEEQQQIRKFVKECIESNEDLIAIAKQIRSDLMEGISMEDLEDGDESK